MKYKVLATAVGVTALYLLLFACGVLVSLSEFNTPDSTNYRETYSVGDVLIKSLEYSGILFGMLVAAVGLVGFMVGMILLVSSIWEKG